MQTACIEGLSQRPTRPQQMLLTHNVVDAGRAKTFSQRYCGGVVCRC